MISTSARSPAAISRAAASEIGVDYPDASFGGVTRLGTPFPMLLRDVVQRDGGLGDAVRRVQDARRTCHLILTLADAKVQGTGAAPVVGVQYGRDVARVMDDATLLPENKTWHPRIPGVVYWAMDWLCPSFNGALGRVLSASHGNVTARGVALGAFPVVSTGNLHVLAVDMGDGDGDATFDAYVAFAAPQGDGGEAYGQGYHRLDLNALFGAERPRL